MVNASAAYRRQPRALNRETPGNHRVKLAHSGQLIRRPRQLQGRGNGANKESRERFTLMSPPVKRRIPAAASSSIRRRVDGNSPGDPSWCHRVELHPVQVRWKPSFGDEQVHQSAPRSPISAISETDVPAMC